MTTLVETQTSPTGHDGAGRSGHAVLRGGAGIIDYTGVGLWVVDGPGATAFLGHVTTRTIDFLLEGQTAVALLLADDGTVIAEAHVSCRGADYLVDVWPDQAAEAGARLLVEAGKYDNVTVRDAAGELSVIGVEGPTAPQIVAPFLDFPLSSVSYRSFVGGRYKDDALAISRTGVSGEYGYKIIVNSDAADEIRDELRRRGAVDVDRVALDICRMEMRFVNIEREGAGDRLDPFELGLQWMVDAQHEFLGRDAALARGQREDRHVPVCWVTAKGAGGERIASGAPVLSGGERVGMVAHAVWSPSLDAVIGTARLSRTVAASGLTFEIESGDGPAIPVTTISAPFVKAASLDVPLE